MTPIELGPGQEQELCLQTAEGNQIPNSQLTEISMFERNQYGFFADQYGDSVEPRTPPTPRYNCHGLSFASRRTWVTGTATIERILKDDSYAEVDVDNVLPGDLIVYFDSETGEIQHTGIVAKLPSEEDCLATPEIYSKWAKWAEVIHPAHQCPYDYGGARFYRVVV